MGRELSTAEAARRLGVKPETLYAYVSRGLLRSRRHPGHRGSVFDADDIEALAARARTGRTPSGAVEAIRTSVTTLDNDQLFYRGQPAVDVAVSCSFEAVAELLWTGQLPPADVPDAPLRWPSPPAEDLRLVRRALATLPSTARHSDQLRLAVLVLGAGDPGRADVTPAAVLARARTVLSVLATTVGRPRAAPGAKPGGVAATLWSRLSDAPADPAALRLLETALVLLADHGLAVSTVAARITASVEGDVYAVISTGLAAAASPRHGSASTLAHQLLTEAVLDPDAAVARRLGADVVPPGFGHTIYQLQDPRAELLLRALPDGPTAHAVDAVCARLDGRPDLFPNVDLAVAALTHAYGMDADAGEAIFLYARIAGWVAHALEEYRRPGLHYRAPGIYTGDLPHTAIT